MDPGLTLSNLSEMLEMPLHILAPLEMHPESSPNPRTNDSSVFSLDEDTNVMLLDNHGLIDSIYAWPSNAPYMFLFFKCWLEFHTDNKSFHFRSVHFDQYTTTWPLVPHTNNHPSLSFRYEFLIINKYINIFSCTA